MVERRGGGQSGGKEGVKHHSFDYLDIMTRETF